MIDVGCYTLSKEANFPCKGTEDSACYDLCACFHDEGVKFHDNRYIVPVEENNNGKFIQLYSGDLALIPTGLIFCLPPTHHMKIYSRSGNVWKRKLVVANQPAIIDSDYTYETFVLLHNMSNITQVIKEGDAIAQCELCKNGSIDFLPVNKEEFETFKELVSISSSRDGGLGSTGK